MSERSNLTRDDGSMFREYNFMLLVGDCAIRQLLLKQSWGRKLFRDQAVPESGSVKCENTKAFFYVRI